MLGLVVFHRRWDIELDRFTERYDDARIAGVTTCASPVENFGVLFRWVREDYFHE